jgi:hypothetical protein
VTDAVLGKQTSKARAAATSHFDQADIGGLAPRKNRSLSYDAFWAKIGGVDDADP